jgi:hypothetical protein
MIGSVGPQIIDGGVKNWHPYRFNRFHGVTTHKTHLSVFVVIFQSKDSGFRGGNKAFHNVEAVSLCQQNCRDGWQMYELWDPSASDIPFRLMSSRKIFLSFGIFFFVILSYYPFCSSIFCFIFYSSSSSFLFQLLLLLHLFFFSFFYGVSSCFFFLFHVLTERICPSGSRMYDREIMPFYPSTSNEFQ